MVGVGLAGDLVKSSMVMTSSVPSRCAGTLTFWPASSPLRVTVKASSFFAITAVAMPFWVVAVQVPRNSSPVVAGPRSTKNHTRTMATTATTAMMTTSLSRPEESLLAAAAAAAGCAP